MRVVGVHGGRAAPCGGREDGKSARATRRAREGTFPPIMGRLIWGAQYVTRTGPGSPHGDTKHDTRMRLCGRRADDTKAAPGARVSQRFANRESDFQEHDRNRQGRAQVHQVSQRGAASKLLSPRVRSSTRTRPRGQRAERANRRPLRGTSAQRAPPRASCTQPRRCPRRTRTQGLLLFSALSLSLSPSFPLSLSLIHPLAVCCLYVCRGGQDRMDRS